MSKRIILSILIVLFFCCDDELPNANINILSISEQTFATENISIEIHLVSEDEIASFEIVLSDAPDKITGVAASSAVCDSISSGEIAEGFKITGIFSEPLLPGEYTLVVAEYLQSENIAEKATTRNQLSFAEKTIETGADSVEIAIILENHDVAGGFQFDISDIPDILVGLSISTELSAFTVSGNENASGYRIIGFSMSGATITVGESEIVRIQYEIVSQPENGEISLMFLDPILSDAAGNALEVSTENGSIIFVEDPVPVPPVPINLFFQKAVLRDKNGKSLAVITTDGVITLQ